ncbi:YafY family transcriptional regulator [Chitinimonas arctica]|uniref:YafY family transcriptional regulator n=1 Tax=Chitinimonas arctica TaxID=2594795 RepID=A0A516SID6_9NEIS|nr:YafY family protein [Chitinimonas arctica]QDQ27919.1 YafY family transcriptional regulator [Chitinimonas arctica]
MRSSRLLSILMLLQWRGRLSATVLAREFEVSVRTIYRDVDALSASGVPVYAERGRQGGITLHKGYRTRLTGLTPGEAESLPLAGIATVAHDLGVGVEAAAAQFKLMASLPAEAGEGVLRIARRFHIDPLPWYHRAEAPDCLPELAKAVWREHRIRIDYESWQNHAPRELAPLGLVLKGGLWYLVASSGGKRPYSYRVSSIRSLEVLDTHFQRPNDFELATHWPAAVAAFERRLLKEMATVRLSEEGCRILRAVSPLAAEQVQASSRPCAREGWIEAEMPIETPEYSARQLLRLGAEVEVLAPASLRRALVHEAQAVLAHYR